MKVSDLITQLQAMPLDADVDIYLGEEFCGFTVVHHTAGEPPPHHVVLELEPDPPHIAEIAAKHQRLADAAPQIFETLQLTAAALQCVAKLLPAGETHCVRFTGKWEGFAPQTIAQILDRANTALEPKAED
jgi:hypothetical protein